MVGLSANLIMIYNNFDKNALLKFMKVFKCSLLAMLRVTSATVLMDKCPLCLHIQKQEKKSNNSNWQNK